MKICLNKVFIFQVPALITQKRILALFLLPRKIQINKFSSEENFMFCKNNLFKLIKAIYNKEGNLCVLLTLVYLQRKDCKERNCFF